jgi:hypothetical protein
LQIAGLVSTLKAACTAFCVLNGEKRVANFQMSQSGTKYLFSSKSTNGCDLRVALLLSTLKVSSITFAVLNGVKRAVNFDMYQSGTQYQSFRLNRQMAVFCEFQGLFRR